MMKKVQIKNKSYTIKHFNKIHNLLLRLWCVMIITIIGSSCNQSFVNGRLQDDGNKLDTIFKEYTGQSKFDSLISFGSSVKNWNRYIAILTKNGYFHEIKDSGNYNSYIGCNNHYEVRAHFLTSGIVSDDIHHENTYLAIRKNNVIQFEPVLNEIVMEFSFKDGEKLANSIIGEFINKHSLSYVVGKKPINGGLIEELHHQKLFGSADKNYKKYIYQQDSSLFENKDMYSVIICSTEQDIRSFMSLYTTEPTHVLFGYKNITVTIKSFSKELSEIDINNYRTIKEKRKIKHQNEQDSLINKALYN